MSQYNTYRFTSIRALREALRSFRDLEATVGTDSISATIYLDLKHALGDDPKHPVSVLTSHQRRLVQQYLIDSLPIAVVAKQNNIAPRVVYYGIRRALEALLEFFETKTEREKDAWKPWMMQLMRDQYLSIEELAIRIGKTEHAVSCAMSRYRKSENIPFRAVRKRTLGG